MSRFRFELATDVDDADLRHVLRETPMAGRISVAFQREPSWFHAAVVDGDERQVVACRDLESGRIIGFGCRSLRWLFVDGRMQRIGYLSSLRVLPDYRNRGLVARGYAFFRRLHADGQAPYYLTTIADGNTPAIATLTSARAGLPRYAPMGLYHTLAIPCLRRGLSKDHSVRAAKNSDLPAIVGFLQAEGPRRQFFTVVNESDFGRDGALRGLEATDLFLAEEAGRIVGVLGAWDQHPFKQTVVVDYHGALRWTRPGLNLWSTLRRRPLLPAPGQPFRFLTAALTVVRDDAPAVFDALLRAAAHARAGGSCSHLLVGLHERDPLLAAAERLAAARYTTHLYVVGWNDADIDQTLASARVPYLELGTL